MSATIATTRLRKELQKLQVDPPPGIIAEPKENDILVWFYAIRGPADTAFEKGVYVGKLKFPSEYPMKAPSIYMLTPSGRFQTNTKICMSMSDFHPESWNPLWSVASIIQGIQSFMASTEMTTGGISAPTLEQKKLAELSRDYNTKNFPTLFHGDIGGAFQRADEARQAAEQKTRAAAARKPVTTKRPIKSKILSKESSEIKEIATSDDNQVPQPELTAEEIEKRRKKNAKKRDKQKAKKVGHGK
jgi:ubiquitin-conjugating enzyme E2 J2